jgi:S-adenosylmethionine hydrolase
MPRPTIALMTDFGTKDIYVGVMKGVIARICPEALVIDLTHEIPPQSVSVGAWALKNAYRYFAEGTIFAAVVDPEVGSERRPLAVEVGGYRFVAPDNGLLTHIIRAHPLICAAAITNPRYRLPQVSATFHGRDVFAPAAAHLATGVPVMDMGHPVEQLVELDIAPAHQEARRIVGSVIHIDHFGNLITNIEPLTWDADRHLQIGEFRFGAPKARITILDTVIRGIQRAYYEARSGDLLAQVDSSGALEIAVYRGSAAAYLGASVGDVVVLEW